MAEEQISQEAVESAPTEEVSRETSDVPIPERPEHIPEKFWNAETGEVKTEDLAKSYINLEKFSTGKINWNEVVLEVAGGTVTVPLDIATATATWNGQRKQKAAGNGKDKAKTGTASRAPDAD